MAPEVLLGQPFNEKADVYRYVVRLEERAFLLEFTIILVLDSYFGKL